MRTFKPHFEILPLPQRQLWPQLKNATLMGFILYGGTAVALRLGHRTSIDFDFFSEKPLDREAIRDSFAFVNRATTLQEQANTWVLLVPPESVAGAHVKLSFFGAITFGRVGEPEFTEDMTLQVASLDDLLATKLKVLLQRSEAKDYIDIATLLTTGVNLARGLSSARTLFGPNFQPSESLKALTYFEDGDLSTLSRAQKQILIDATKTVHALPEVVLRSQSLGN